LVRGKKKQCCKWRNCHLRRRLSAGRSGHGMGKVRTKGPLKRKERNKGTRLAVDELKTEIAKGERAKSSKGGRKTGQTKNKTAIERRQQR